MKFKSTSDGCCSVMQNHSYRLKYLITQVYYCYPEVMYNKGHTYTYMHTFLLSRKPGIVY